MARSKKTKISGEKKTRKNKKKAIKRKYQSSSKQNLDKHLRNQRRLKQKEKLEENVLHDILDGCDNNPTNCKRVSDRKYVEDNVKLLEDQKKLHAVNDVVDLFGKKLDKLLSVGSCPDVLSNLTLIEQLLIARVHPVIQVYRLVGGQTGYSGHVDFKIRKKNVLDALLFLKKNNKYYHDIVIDDIALNSLPSDDYFHGNRSNMEDEENDREHDVSSMAVPSTAIYHSEEKIKHNMNWPNISTNAVKELTCPYISQAFPTLFPYGNCDLHEIRDKKLTPRIYFQYLMEYYDGRFASHKIFPYFAFNTVMRWECLSKGTIYIKDHPLLKKMNIQVLKDIINENPNFMKDLLVYGSNIRGTREFWSSRANELSSLCDFLGLPTIFFTASAADMKWPRLRELICEHMSLSNVDDKAYYKLVLENPKACSDYFYEIFTMFFECIVLGYFQVVDFWYRFEWQMRGSPHVHGVMWLSNAVDVKMLESKFEEVKISVINFFDRLISCETPNLNFVDVGTHPCSVKIADTTCVEDDLSALINTVQMHECSKRCTNDGKTKCKYGFPKDLRENSDLVLSKRKYYEFHGKRNHPNINQYNTIWLRSLRSNCDFGAILSDGGFRHYIAKYASKSEVKSRPLLDILSSILSGINESTSVRSTIQRSFMAALVERDYSAQEVHHLLCGKKLFSCSRSFVKVNLKTSNWKYHMNLDDDVLKDSYNHILYSYSKRPLKLHNVCLLRYVEMFNIEKYSVRRRKAVAVVFPRLRCHGDNIDLEEIARQLVLLYVPWIDLDEICGNGNQWQDIMRKYNLSINLLPYYKGQEATESMNELISSDNENDDVSEESGPTCDKDDWMLFVGASVGENTSSHPVQEFVVTSWVRNYCSSEDGLTFMKFIDDAKKEGIEHVLRYRDQNIKLSEDQKHIINLASCQISCIKDGSGLSNFPQLVLCQGAAGSGKTLVIAELECMITEAFGNDSALIIAFTGSAALNANGRTIHSALRLQFDNKSKDVIDLKGDTLRAFEEKMRNVKFLIIEEFSMVGCRLFNIINRRCMQMKSSTEPFGGLPVYMFGDLFQLPPIGDTPLYNLNIDPFKTIAYSGSILFRSLVHTKFFSACHRQRDQEFLNFLENLSCGIVTVPGQMYISDRFEENMTHEEIESFSDAVHLFQHVKATEDYNKNKLLELGKPIIQICAKNNNSYAKCSSDDLACNLQNTLELSIGARVMLRSNLWTEGGLVNGCIGYVEDVLYCNEIDEEYPSIIMVKFDSYFGPTLSNGCVPITRITRSWTVNNIHCTRYQFPLTLAYAITIHKSQGLTLSKCVLHFDCAEIMSGIFYVSMSRVREKTDLMISGNFMGSPLFRINSANYKAKIAGRQWLMERSKFEVFEILFFK
ncbi:ATP-dependent DNA helicase [Frankliniella fusca]|uniref:ATP-dependent DNA helicase n=1 Tax=Frankliniella fusca TaxID=407009 RepID=A0AAE1GSH1_9NEOP|nr:ATP-dependent DNA helicase [Frankliniella fusca]